MPEWPVYLFISYCYLLCVRRSFHAIIYGGSINSRETLSLFCLSSLFFFLSPSPCYLWWKMVQHGGVSNGLATEQGRWLVTHVFMVCTFMAVPRWHTQAGSGMEFVFLILVLGRGDKINLFVYLLSCLSKKKVLDHEPVCCSFFQKRSFLTKKAVFFLNSCFLKVFVSLFEKIISI